MVLYTHNDHRHCLLIATVIALVLTQFNTNIFVGDNVVDIPYFVGLEPITWNHLWSQCNEHRIPLPRLLMHGTFIISGGDFRAAAILCVVLLSVLSLIYIWTAKRLRGDTSYTDLFFPLIVLGISQHETFLSGFQIAFVMSTFLAGVVLAVIVSTPQELSFRSSILVVVCLIALPLCGAQGIMWSLPMGAWLILAGIRQLRSGAKRDAFLLIAGVVVIYALIVCYFIGFSLGKSPVPILVSVFQSTIQYFFLCQGTPRFE